MELGLTSYKETPDETRRQEKGKDLRSKGKMKRTNGRQINRVYLEAVRPSSFLQVFCCMAEVVRECLHPCLKIPSVDFSETLKDWKAMLATVLLSIMLPCETEGVYLRPATRPWPGPVKH